MLTALRRVEHELGVSTALHLIDRLARRAGNVSWFGNVGATWPMSYHDATVYARLLGIGHSHPAKPMGWNAAVGSLPAPMPSLKRNATLLKATNSARRRICAISRIWWMRSFATRRKSSRTLRWLMPPAWRE